MTNMGNRQRAPWLAVLAMSVAPTALLAQTVPPDQAAPINSVEAQGDDTAVPDIVVTAQKRSERLQDIPIAATVLSGSALAEKGVASTLDLPVATPGLTITQVSGAASPRIRGIGAVNSFSGNENAVATYVDGVYYASPNATLLSLSNIDQVAVLKGPQGTLFGRNATGGAIQITTRNPSSTFGGQVTGTYGNRDTAGGTLYLTGGLAPGVAANLSVDYENQMDGFGENQFNGRDVNKSRNLNLRAKVKWDIGDLTTIKLNADYSKLDAAGPGRRPTTGSLPSTRVPFTGGGYDVRSNIQPSYASRQGGVSLEAVHHFDRFDLVSISAYRDGRTHLVLDVDGLPQQIISVDNRFLDTQFSQEVQLVSKNDGPFSWVIGGYYFWYKGGYEDGRFSFPTATQAFESLQHSRSIAGFAQPSYKIGSATTLTAGILYSDERQRQSADGAITARVSGITVTPPAISDRTSVGKPTWRLALDHHLGASTLVYASYNRGFKSGGFNLSTFTPPTLPYAPEKIDAFEAGVKTDFLDRRVRFNASGFYYDYSNIQLSSYVNGQLRISNAAKAKIYGLDADVTAKPTTNLTLTAGASYIHDRLGDFPNAQISTPLATGGNAIASGQARGNRLPNTPDWTLSLGADYVVPLARGKITTSAQYLHNDGWVAEADNRLRQSPYDLLNARIRWDLRDSGGLSVSAWGRNLTNALYAAQLQTQTTTDIFIAATGRTYGLTLGFQF